jgi:hypothetical protein
VLIHLGSGRHFFYIQYILSNATINKTEVVDFAAHIIYTTALAICRLSGLAFYARIADRHQQLMWANWAAVAFIIAAYLPQVFLIIFHCLPVTALWLYSFQLGVDKYTCLQWGVVYVTNSAISLVCDLILFSIPIAIISSLRISVTSKIKLSFILMPGLLVIAISCARMYLVVVGQWDADESWSYDYLLAIEVSEIGSTLVALSIPALKPLFGSLFASLDRTFISRDYSKRRLTGGTVAGSGHSRSKRGIELGSVLSRAKASVSRHPTGALEHDRSASKDPGELYTTSNAFLATPGRVPSTGSGISQQPMLQRDVNYSVSATRAGVS